MACEWQAIFRGGGRPLIELLRFAIYCNCPELLFLFLVREYKNRWDRAAALAIYDVFCVRLAPLPLGTSAGRPLSADTLIPTLEMMRKQWEWLQKPHAEEEKPPVPMTVPAPYVFDRVVADVEAKEGPAIAALCARFDPAQDALDQLPGGRLSPGRRQWVEKVWEADLRPRLTAAGFHRLIGV